MHGKVFTYILIILLFIPANLSMTDNTISTQKILELKESLLIQRDALHELLQRSSESSEIVELDQQAFGRVSRQDALLQQNMAKATVQQTAEHLRQITQALARIESGDYGYCADCDGLIKAARLTARPESLFCLSCQSKREQTMA